MLEEVGRKDLPKRHAGAIGVFDSGYGGLTVLQHLMRALPEHDFIYLGDNARAPYGPHSFEVIYRYTKEAVSFLFEVGCPLVILACNTASARALRTLQQRDLPISDDPTRRILGVIRPVVEYLGRQQVATHVGLVGTRATVSSNSYGLEVEKYAPEIKLTQLETPMWVPLVEQGEVEDNEGVRFFLQRDLQRLLGLDPEITLVQLACTHYPLLLPRIRELLPTGVEAIEQGPIVAASLVDYLQRHPEMAQRLNQSYKRSYYTTEEPSRFADMASHFLGQPLDPAIVSHVTLPTL